VFKPVFQLSYGSSVQYVCYHFVCKDVVEERVVHLAKIKASYVHSSPFAH